MCIGSSLIRFPPTQQAALTHAPPHPSPTRIVRMLLNPLDYGDVIDLSVV